MCNLIFEEFGLDQCESRIVNGHVPVKKRMVKVRLKQMENCLSLMVDFRGRINGKRGLQAIR